MCLRLCHSGSAVVRTCARSSAKASPFGQMCRRPNTSTRPTHLAPRATHRRPHPMVAAHETAKQLEPRRPYHCVLVEPRRSRSCVLASAPWQPQSSRQAHSMRRGGHSARPDASRAGMDASRAGTALGSHDPFVPA
eukprot:scaffold8457_cov112-Isochrysis_galbana.AAC.2